MKFLDKSEFWGEVFTLNGSVTPNIKFRIFVFGVFATIVWGFATFTDLIPTSGIAPYEVVGAVLALLLVLRTNTGYDRWYEGRKLWGGIVNQSRELAQIGLAYGPSDNPAWRSDFVRWTAAFSHACRHSLRGERDLRDMRSLLNPRDLEQLASACHMPMYVAQRLARMLRSAADNDQIDRFAFLEGERQRALLIDHVGACERIMKTPLAKAFSVKIRRFMFLYLIALPFGIFDKAGMMTPIIVMLVAYPLLSLDQIGFELQNPFAKHRLSHLPLDDICQTIEENLLASLNEESSAYDNDREPLLA